MTTRTGTEPIAVIPPSFGKSSHLRALMVAVATFRPKVSVLKEFLRRACLATPKQARTALRRIAGGFDTFEFALPSQESESSSKLSPFQTNGVAPFKKGTLFTKGGKAK
jgi:hypothetical protein